MAKVLAVTVVELPFSLSRHPLDLSDLFARDPRGPQIDQALRLRDVARELSKIVDSLESRAGRDGRVVRKVRRALSEGGHATALTEAASAGLTGSELSSFRALVAESSIIEADIQAAYAAVSRRKAAQLRHVLRTNDDLRWAIRSLGADLERSRLRVVDHQGDPDKRYRKHELVFTRIASRAGTKTSPLSRFNTVQIHSSDESLDFDVLPTRFSLHNAALYELLEAIALSPEGIDLFTWKVRPYTSVVDSAIVVYTEGWNGEAASVYRTREGAIRLPASPLLLRIIASDAPWSIPRLRDEVDLTHEAARALVRRLSEIGLLQLSPLPSDRSDLARAIALAINTALAGAEDQYPAIAECVKGLRGLSAGLADLNRQPTAASLDLVSTILFDLRQRWGARGRRGTGGLTYEDYVEEGPRTHALSGPKFDDLAAVLALWPLFDVNLRIQLTFRAAVRARDGASMQAADADFYRMAVAANTTYRNFWSAPWRAIPSDVPEVRLLDGLRDRFIESMTSQDDEERVRILPEVVDRLLRELPSELAKLSASYTVLYMEHGEDLVLNRIYPGHQAFLGRFLRHSSIPTDYQQFLSDFYSEPEQTVADIYETYGFNATARPVPPVPRRVVSIYTRDRDADIDYAQVIDLHSAEVDTSQPRVRLRTPSGEIIQPIITSNLIRTFFPAYTAFTGNLYGNVNHLMELSTVFVDRLDPNRPVSTPRISFGHIVIERRRWFLATRLLEVDPRISPHGRFVALAAILSDLQLPTRFYFHIRLHHFGDDPIASFSQEFGKPQFFDLENPLLINVLMNALKDSRWVMVVEALPEQAGTPEHLREFMVRSEASS
ncbi:hypothetical protein [Microbacterium aurugineum]